MFALRLLALDRFLSPTPSGRLTGRRTVDRYPRAPRIAFEGLAANGTDLLNALALSDKTPRRPVWEEIHPKDADELLEVIAIEIWHRTRAPECAARIAEAELSVVKAKGAWQALLALDSLVNDLVDARSNQATAVGYWLAATARLVDDVDVEEWCQLAMEWAGLEPISETLRALYDARSREADAARKKILEGRGNEKGTA